MSWLKPSPYEKEILDEVRSIQPEIVQLAQLTALARTVEPLLLRNMRQRFLPSTETELETALWYSPLVSVYSNRNFVLHHGVARLLANDLKQKDHWLNDVEALNEKPRKSAIDEDYKTWQNKLWDITQQYTQHWTALDKLEQQLRFYTLQKQPEKLQQGIRHILHEISHSQTEKDQLKLARWAKKTLPVVIDTSSKLQEIAWLAQYSAEALGTTAQWTLLSKPQLIPDWLAKALPDPIEFPESEKYQIGIKTYLEPQEHCQILEFVSIKSGAETFTGNILPLTTPLPAQLHISFGKTGRPYIISVGTRIKLKGRHQRIILATIDGKQYELLLNLPNNTKPDQTTENQPTLYLLYIKEDASQAEFIRQWLSQHDIKVILVEDKPQPLNVGVQDDQAVLIRLWTPAAHQLWKAASSDSVQDTVYSFSNNLLLRTEVTAIPIGVNPAQIIELPEWQGEEQSSQSRQLLAAIHDWMAGTPKPFESSTNKTEELSEDFSPKVSALLKELENRDTPPKRRLEIGDLLDEIGDPRLGVGVREYEVIEYSLEVQQLLNELNTLDTEPPRRLEIGRQLSEMGDPRPGVGVDEEGLPDIDWVEIPAGEFIYGEGFSGEDFNGEDFSGEDSKSKKPHLDTYYISRYPITHEQFQTFIEAKGYQEKQWWDNLKKPEPKQSRWQQPNCPKETIDWYESLAFTRWLSEQLGYKVTLPTEQQWEKAARGLKGRNYPWGDQYIPGYANVDEKENKDGDWYLEETTAVGMYPQGNTDTGIADLAGNVWEWCLDKYGKSEKPTAIDTSGDSRVLRGGSWILDTVDARAPYRGRFSPANRNLSLGFRVVCVLPFTER